MTINFSQFCDGFSDTYKNNFSYEGKRALYDYLEEYEDSTDEQVEFDPVALCCEYTEYDSLGDILSNYQNINDLQDLEDHTQVIKVEGKGYIIQDF